MKLKKFAINSSAVILQVGAPIGALILNGGALFTESAGKTLSAMVWLILIICTPIFTKMLKGKSISKPTVTKAWMIMFMFCLLIMSITKELLWISGAGIVGNLGAYGLYSWTDKITAKEEFEKTVSAVIEGVKASEEVK